MLFRSIPCLWITVCLRLCCYVDSAEAQNAKEGKFLKFGLLIPLHLEDILQNERRGVQTSRQIVALLFLRFRCYFFSILINSKGGCILCQMRPVCGDDSAAIPGCLRSTSPVFLRTAVKRCRARIRRKSSSFYFSPAPVRYRHK